MSTNSVLTPCKQGAVLSRYSDSFGTFTLLRFLYTQKIGGKCLLGIYLLFWGCLGILAHQELAASLDVEALGQAGAVGAHVAATDAVDSGGLLRGGGGGDACED